jgi:hypothetical protein
VGKSKGVRDGCSALLPGSAVFPSRAYRDLQVIPDRQVGVSGCGREGRVV